MLLTVDTPVAGARLRDVRNGLTIPPRLSLRTFVDGVLHPRWWFDQGVQSPADARRVVDAGADGVLLSNHGGRQLERAPVPLEVLPSVVAAVGGRATALEGVGRRNRFV